MGKSDYLTLILFILIAGIFVYLLFFTFYSVFIQPLINFIYLIVPLNPVFRKLLSEKFPYYESLNTKEKRKFRYRLKYFLMSKDFHGKHGLDITDEMKIMIGASAVQITFGFQPLQLTNFNKILLYPNAYYSKKNKTKQTGEVKKTGIIAFSWEDFLKGYKIVDNGQNTGLHQMAHAIRIEDYVPNNEYAFLDEEVLGRWQQLAEIELKKGEPMDNKFLHSYAYQNSEEFFAVSVEHFFEQPEEFNRIHPDLYQTLAELLKQNPLDRKK